MPMPNYLVNKFTSTVNDITHNVLHEIRWLPRISAHE